ncbi:DegT/DnrJ/EryC1/StrS family aminotransferase [Naumannella halotolerans]|uniref:UDP-4-amino-4-deoxy-L-arabinose-oxoglutarate aminotransferase n=1 Tax=Naumannella halotolerans TaxID=993414 RepID=A0A4R7J1A8_9ACTN|nr:DegT/DnrJ/EryC1/StrS family aminotransferase [Naumannella halotolerans]TDT30107.1 UDP-4-amino-4-deoxy-L-arabinose-oxoglutarate aminotransferase [Naumannella halotolerans]
MDDLIRVAMNARPTLDSSDHDSVIEALNEGLLGRGPQGEAFEKELGDYLQAPDVVTVASGTVALQLALMAAGVGPGDEVGVPSFTFCASIQAIIAIGAKPIFIDNAPSSLALDVDDVLRALTPQTRAVMPVHYAGRHVDLSPIMPELDRRGVAVIADAAHSFGSVRADGSPMTAGAEWVCFSFDAIKNITCGEGGAIIPPKSQSGAAPRLLRALGVDRENTDIRRGDYIVTMHGIRAHLAEMNAALGRSQLARFDRTAADRRRAWHEYRRRLQAIEGANIYDVDIDHTVPFNCAVTVDPALRDDLVQALRARGIGVGRHYPVNHRQPAFQVYDTRPLPNAEWAGAAVLTLPFGPDMTRQQITIVCDALAQELLDQQHIRSRVA